MSKIKNFINTTSANLKSTVARFPAAILFLVTITSIVFTEIEGNNVDDNILARIAFSCIFGAFLSVGLQFAVERFSNLRKYSLMLSIFPFVSAAAYYLFMTNGSTSQSMIVHLFVIVFAVFAATLYIPSSKNKMNFGNVFLAHFKSAFISVLYSAVLFLGIAAIISAIDLLLYNMDYKVYAHNANIVFTFFLPVYYLSLLPKFNSQEEEDIRKSEISYNYPRVLEILVSYITIPLISIFSIVLIIYFIKILATRVWPVGQVGPMVLGYSAAVYVIYILGSNLKNRLAVLFRKVFPFVLIPLVVMQLVSSYIRIEAYGITESRYYVVLFGIFSIAGALMLIFSKNKNPGAVVLLSACFAVISIIPPVDAFTVSMNSQKSRLEEILTRNEMIEDNQIIPKSDLTIQDRHEITSITDYMFRMGYLEEVEFFPAKYAKENSYYGNFDKIYGFNPQYGTYTPEEEPRFMYAMLDGSKQMDIEGFDKFIRVNIFKSTNKTEKIGEINLDGKNYTINQKFEDNELIIYASDENNSTLVEVSLKQLIDGLLESVGDSKSVMDPEVLTVNKTTNEMKMKVIINEINIDRTVDEEMNINGNIFVFIAIP